MNLYILRWNPNISSYKTDIHQNLIYHIKNNEQPSDFNWSIREYENLAKDDMFILQQVGTGENDGIAMIGKFKDSCYESDSWRKDKSKLYYADMWIMDAFDCDKENPLSAKRYEKLFPEIQWHGGHSGIVVEEDLDDKLVNQIEKDLIEAGIWEEGELDKFMALDLEAEIIVENLEAEKNTFLNDRTKDNLIKFIDCLMNSKVLIPMHIEYDENGDKKCFPMILDTENGDVCPIFSNEDQVNNQYQNPDCEIYDIPVMLAIEIIKESKETIGLILDPFTNPFLIDRVIMKNLLGLDAQKKRNGK